VIEFDRVGIRLCAFGNDVHAEVMPQSDNGA
jgi:hypothetical protein